MLNIDVPYGVVAVAADCFCYVDSQRLPAAALSTICLFGCLACVWAFGLLYTRLSTHFSAVCSVVTVFVMDIRFLG